MSLRIRTAAPPDATRLRQLILDSLPHLIGAEAQALPSAGGLPDDTLMAVGADHRLWVVSFSAIDAGAALLDGLAARREIRALLPWLRQAGLISNLATDCTLLILTPTLPTGAVELCRKGDLEWQQMRFLEVNGEIGILTEPCEFPPATAARPQPAELKPLDREPPKPTLTPEEEAFFQRL
ncbi:MAG: hypothetical protein WCY26_11405 [Thiohalobacteraceae bacterium]|nr:hypothetical protein [Gammaproteobacteria bacterium]